MPDWSPLREACLRNDPNAKRLAFIRRVEWWLDLPRDRAIERGIEEVVDEATARAVNEALMLVRVTYRRELGISMDPADSERFEQLSAGYVAGALTPQERRLWERLDVASAIGAKLAKKFQAIAAPASPPPPDEEKLRAALAALFERQFEAQKFTVGGRANAERLNEMEALLAEYRTLFSSVAPQRKEYGQISLSAGHAAYALGRGWSLLGAKERAAERYAEASALFAQAGVPEDAAASAKLARDLGYAEQADIDAASAQDLRALVEGKIDPMDRARAYVRLSQLSKDANDIYDAAEYAEKAALALEKKCDFPDPEKLPFDAAFDVWIQTCCRPDRAPGELGPLKLIFEIGQMYLSILSMRHAVRAAADPAGAKRVEAVMGNLSAAISQASAQCDQALREALIEFKRYAPMLDAGGVVSQDDAFLAQIKELSQRLVAIQVEANEAEAKGDRSALDALLERSAAALKEALALGLPETVGRAHHVDAYVRLRAGDFAGAIEATRAGEAAILAGAPATLEAVATHPQFALLLMLRKVRLQAFTAQNDTPALFAGAKETVRLIEAQRYRISDPYQQGAFLADRTIFYEMLLISAFKLQCWDDVLSGMELIKARAALLNSLSPLPAIDESELTSRLAEANATLARAPAESSERLAANEQRRLLLGLQAIERRRAAGVPPATLDVAEVQKALAANEAAIAWVWISRQVLLVLALDSERVHCERVILAEHDRAWLDDYVKILHCEHFKEQTAVDLAALAQHLVAAVLPAQTRQFVANARRLILSPHRALHLLPFHAANLDGGFLIERFAIRYAPNLGGLLAPWRNASARTDGGLLAIGVNKFAVPGEKKKWADLDTAETEAKAAAETWAAQGQPADLLTGPAASVEAFLALGDRLSTYRCLHLATHGASVFDREAANDPFASRLILQNGSLDAQTIGQLRLGAEVVVLSACHSGQRALGGRGLAELPGDDVFGLQAALFEAGVHGVIGALWPVHEDVAPVIMKKLHEGLAAGIAPEIALQQALLAYLHLPNAYANIFFWAPIFLNSIGCGAEPRPS
jgi:CHAT domain-containing protein